MSEPKDKVKITIEVNQSTFDSLQRIADLTKQSIGEIVDSFFPKPK